MPRNYSKKDIRQIGELIFRMGHVEFEITPGVDKIGYSNVMTEMSGTASIEELRKAYGNDVASFFQSKLKKGYERTSRIVN